MPHSVVKEAAMALIGTGEYLCPTKLVFNISVTLSGTRQPSLVAITILHLRQENYAAAVAS